MGNRDCCYGVVSNRDRDWLRGQLKAAAICAIVSVPAGAFVYGTMKWPVVCWLIAAAGCADFTGK